MNICNQEEWRPISGFEDFEVSNLGRVRNLDRHVSVFRNGKQQSRKYRGRILAQSADAHGYRRVCLNVSGRQHGRIVHRLVVEAFVRKMTDDEEVNHLDFKKNNNCLGNLEITTTEKNREHAARNGRMAKKLNRGQVIEIKKCLKRKQTRQILADRFGVSYRLIRLIDVGELWQHVYHVG